MPSCCAVVVDDADFADPDAFVDPDAIVTAGTSVESDKYLLVLSSDDRSLPAARSRPAPSPTKSPTELGALVAAGARPHRHGALRALAVADDEHVRHLLQLGLPDLISNLLLALVELDPQPRRLRAGRGPTRRRRRCRSAIGSTMAWTGASHSGKRPGVVLDQDRDEPLEAAEDRPVDDDRPVLGVVGADVFQVEALRRLVIELDRRALPLPADRVGDVEVDLRAVERAVALVERRRAAPRARAPPSAAPRRDPRSRSRRGTRSGRVDSFAVYSRPKSPYTRCTRPSSRSTSSPICSCVTKQCASSCENCRTRVRPESTPDASLRCSGVCS